MDACVEIQQDGGNTNTLHPPHPVNEALQEPLGAVNPCRHVLSVLQRKRPASANAHTCTNAHQQQLSLVHLRSHQMLLQLGQEFGKDLIVMRLESMEFGKTGNKKAYRKDGEEVSNYGRSHFLQRWSSLNCSHRAWRVCGRSAAATAPRRRPPRS